jgi:hypothetical protein
MKIKNVPPNIISILRNAGYHSDRIQRNEEMSFSRSLLVDRYPRFHIYYNEERREINLHLDHKAPKYESAHDHGAEHDGKMIEEEVERINSFF